MTAKIKLEADPDEFALEKYLSETIMKTGKLQSVVVGCNSPDAKQVEFGMNNGGRLFSAKNPPEDFKKWVGDTYGLTGEARDKKARQEYYKFKELGMPPMPFFRPALHSVLRRVGSQEEWFSKEGNDMMEFARLVSEEAKRVARESKLPMSNELCEKMFFAPGKGVDMSQYLLAMSPDTMMRGENGEAERSDDKINKGSKKRHAGNGQGI